MAQQHRACAQSNAWAQRRCEVQDPARQRRKNLPIHAVRAAVRTANQRTKQERLTIKSCREFGGVMMHKKWKLVVATTIACAGWSLPQTASAAEASSGGLDEIVVTAQRRTEKEVDVPISVTTLSDSGLRNDGITSMDGLAQAVPGMHIDATGPYFQPSIRGVGTAVAGQGVSPSVATYIDGIYQPNPLFNNFNFIDVDSVQVL